jgi:Cd2+/Zn2+-exporting ATPase
LKVDCDDAVLEKVKACVNTFEEARIVEEAVYDTRSHLAEWIRMGISAVLLVAAIVVGSLGGSLTDIFSYVLYGLSYLAVGYPILWSTVKNVCKGRIFDENFLMTVAAVGALCLQEFWEGVMVLLLYQFGETLQSLALGSSRKRVAALIEMKAESALRLADGGAETVAPEQLAIGDKLLIKAGDKIPCDCVLLTASASLDMKSLTGETALVSKTAGEELLAGSLNAGNAFMAKVARTYENSAVAKILDMVENATERKAPPEKFITKFAKIYTPIVCMLAVCIALFPPLVEGLVSGSFGFENGAHWLKSALTFLVISCPCALVISVPLTYFSGVGACAKQGILVKSAAALDKIAKAKVAALDKTGTLTKGNFSIIGAYPEEGTQDELLSVCAALEAYSSHPIAAAFSHLQLTERAESVEEIAGKGLKGLVGGKTAVFGTVSFLREEGYEVDEKASADTVLYLAYDGRYFGCLEIGDVIREESQGLLSDLRGMNIHTVMLTGDSPARAQKVANAIGMSAFKAGLLPTEKVEEMKKLKELGTSVYVGDGINDAPVMTVADCAVSMGSLGSAAAVEASDFVLVSDALGAVSQLMRTAKKTKRIVYQNIVFSILMKVAFMVLGLFPWFPLWLAVFADVGVMLLAVLNSLRVRK